MTKRNWMIKWSLYGVGLLFVLLMQIFITDRIIIFGVRPILIPLAVVIVAAFEGTVGGAGFGLYAGILSFAAFYEANIPLIIIYPVIGLLTGLIAEYIIQSNLVCSFLCSLGYLALFELWNIVVQLFGGTSFPLLLRVAIPEMIYSILLFFLLYLLFRAIFRRVGGIWS